MNLYLVGEFIKQRALKLAIQYPMIMHFIPDLFCAESGKYNVTFMASECDGGKSGTYFTAPCFNFSNFCYKIVW